jgi:hypothetical protein
MSYEEDMELEFKRLDNYDLNEFLKEGDYLYETMNAIEIKLGNNIFDDISVNDFEWYLSKKYKIACQVTEPEWFISRC